MFGFPAPAANWDGVISGPHNFAALRIVASPEDWATPVLCISGPAKAGMTYLAQAWADRFDGEYLTPARLGKAGRRGLDSIADRHVALDDADFAAAKHDEALLSLINLMGAGGGRLLLTAHRSPSQWRTASADLKSRLNAMPEGEYKAPDDDLVRLRLQAGAERRFMKLSPEVLNYLVPRLELAYEAVENFIDRLSDAVSDNDRAPSLPLARKVLEQMGEGAGDDEA